MKSKWSNNKIPGYFEFEYLTFDIYLKFACLREAASAKAGILKFDMSLSKFIGPCLRNQLISTK
jgi:hypothetical protein